MLMQRERRALLLLPRRIFMRNPDYDVSWNYCKLGSYEMTQEEED